MIPTGIHPNHGWQCSKRDPARYFVEFHATSAGQKQQESMNHPEKKWKKLDNGKSADDAAGANRALSPDEIDAEAWSTVHATDGKHGEVETGIVSFSESGNSKTRGLWRVMSVAEIIEHGLPVYAEKDQVTSGARVYNRFADSAIYQDL
ncbi:hypothetical protein EDD16DRAFT_1525610 [Pisolithus croceorrhizus]|nr:hypothetical protein EDD16DRAFT_1525610 [Pisolithus croceorrhizus]KAI6135362.1 hypothetical protein EV401DRAFT_1882003 [Pisolithus croceorrhizus]KAI6158944.1 hypothetical protein EDD17DRAFT_1511612 [Pisolithus thermaeus]